MLNFEIRKIVSVRNLDTLVKNTYGIPYSFQQQDGCKPRGCNSWFEVPMSKDEVDEYDFEATEIPEVINHEDMGVSFAAWLARDPNKPLDSDDRDKSWGIQMWYQRNFYPALEPLVQDLYNKGLIPAGEYYIDIDW